MDNGEKINKDYKVGYKQGLFDAEMSAHLALQAIKKEVEEQKTYTRVIAGTQDFDCIFDDVLAILDKYIQDE